LIDSKQLGTIEISTGLQVSGVFKRMIRNEDNDVVYFETEGETALAYRETEVIGHGVSRHQNGFRSPLGKLKGINLAIENMGPRDLSAYDFYDGKPIEFEFDSGIKVKGMNVTGMRNLKGELMLIQFTDCTVTYKDEVLFTPEDGDFDMAVGKEVISAFAGAADYLSFDLVEHQLSTLGDVVAISEEEKTLNTLYKKVRAFRESKNDNLAEIMDTFTIVKNDFPNDWLLPLEIYELTKTSEILVYLKSLQHLKPKVSHLIKAGLELIED
jgi:phenylalanine-4-hydroxylase